MSTCTGRAKMRIIVSATSVKSIYMNRPSWTLLSEMGLFLWRGSLRDRQECQRTSDFRNGQQKNMATERGETCSTWFALSLHCTSLSLNILLCRSSYSVLIGNDMWLDIISAMYLLSTLPTPVGTENLLSCSFHHVSPIPSNTYAS